MKKSSSRKAIKAKPVKKVKKTVKPVKKVKKTVKPVKKVTKIKKVAKKVIKKKAVPKKQVKKVLKKKAPIKIVSVKVIKRGKAKGKSRYTASELLHFKEILLKERKEILESAKANMKSLVDDESGDYVGENLTYASHMAEQGTDEMEREKNYMFVQRDEKYLGYLQEALTRIDLGTYGVCIDCFDVPKYLCKTCPLIPKERLELVPITQHCIECKNIRG